MKLTEVQIKEIKDAAVQAAKDYVANRAAQGKESSPSVGLVHAGLMTCAIMEVKSLAFVDDDNLDKAIFHTLVELENGSALRQKLGFKKAATNLEDEYV